jgi:uncharacterized membrane protein
VKRKSRLPAIKGFRYRCSFHGDKKNRPYIKFNAVQSLVATVVLSILATVTFGCGSILFLVLFWWGYQAYQGQDVKIPMISDFIRNQGWA